MRLLGLPVRGTLKLGFAGVVIAVDALLGLVKLVEAALMVVGVRVLERLWSGRSLDWSFTVGPTFGTVRLVFAGLMEDETFPVIMLSMPLATSWIPPSRPAV